MSGKVRTSFERKTGKETKLVAVLYDEREYAEALVEHLSLRFNWIIVLSGSMGKEIDEADLILAEERWFEQLRNRDDLWNKTVFLLENHPQEIELTRNEFPYLIWKYDGFHRIRRRIAEAMEEMCGREGLLDCEEPPAFVVGAWDLEADDCRELACELAGQIRENVLYLNLEKYSGDEMKAALELDYCLEDILYYVLDRMEVDGINTTETIRSIVDVRNGVCSLPDFQGYNPLLRLQKRQWHLLLHSLYEATGAEAMLMWMGRDEMDRFPYEEVDAIQCVYVKPGELDIKEEKRWNKMKYGMEHDLENLFRVEVRMVDSWTEALEAIQKHGYDLV